MQQNQKSIEDITRQLSESRKNPILLVNGPISMQSTLGVWGQLRNKSFKHLDIVLNTLGGDPDAAYKMAKLVRKHAETVSVIVPLVAKSAGTLFSLAADEIVLGEMGELGPLDTQLKEHIDGGQKKFSSALDGFKALEQIKIHNLQNLDTAAASLSKEYELRPADAIELAIKYCGETSGTLYSKLEPNKIGEYARALDIGENYGIRILVQHRGLDFEKAQNTVRSLVRGYPSHEFVLDYDELEFLGFNVSMLELDENLSQTCEELVAAFCQIINVTKVNLIDTVGESSKTQEKSDDVKEEKSVGRANAKSRSDKATRAETAH